MNSSSPDLFFGFGPFTVCVTVTFSGNTSGGLRAPCAVRKAISFFPACVCKETMRESLPLFREDSERVGAALAGAEVFGIDLDRTPLFAAVGAFL